MSRRAPEMTEVHRVLEALRGVSPNRTARGIGSDIAPSPRPTVSAHSA
jgi:hypothetical protein